MTLCSNLLFDIGGRVPSIHWICNNNAPFFIATLKTEKQTHKFRQNSWLKCQERCPENRPLTYSHTDLECTEQVQHSYAWVFKLKGILTQLNDMTTFLQDYSKVCSLRMVLCFLCSDKGLPDDPMLGHCSLDKQMQIIITNILWKIYEAQLCLLMTLLTSNATLKICNNSKWIALVDYPLWYRKMHVDADQNSWIDIVALKVFFIF